ncbi:SPOR domain-containing protein [Crenobacter cavernae]|uniref:SPOR domain-containing protein n=1 Tax=Crenobacter cavernae TaxID=2290923 RepID=A0ABY0FFZ2_9NEIS|nr:SPOR domain-containing protein [Crenobacter cavernae]RXZ43573.1 SPOR domain-containing protein [Crenobacter cavernae]
MSNRDFKNTSRSSSSRPRGKAASSKGGGGILAGLLIGLIIGVAVVVGAVMYFNRVSTPFSNLEKNQREALAGADDKPEILAPGTRIAEAIPETASQPSAVPAPAATQAPATAPQPVAKAETSKQPAAPKEEEPQFDFYKILPGQLDAVPGEGGKNGKEPSAPAAAKKSYLQAGAFQHETEADNLKAKLALLGVEAKIQSVNVPDKGLVHRVRVGPFSRPEDLERVRAQLKQDGIDTAVVKVDN